MQLFFAGAMELEKLRNEETNIVQENARRCLTSHLLRGMMQKVVRDFSTVTVLTPEAGRQMCRTQDLISTASKSSFPPIQLNQIRSSFWNMKLEYHFHYPVWIMNRLVSSFLQVRKD
ncbi:unnamed protein product [Citrullus colocynthis]|uniref:Uncharacterized protein n=1 Tax=Citrullus colocynthis TaxID=252529 RepID=A0ABP0ZH68_9ROSI